MNSLINKRALVTGGSSGIGKAIAALFVQEGARVAIVGSNEEKGRATAEEIGATFYACDVANTRAVEALIQKILAEFGSIDILVNNAGVTKDNLLMKMSEEDWDKVIAINLKSVYNFTKPLVRVMMKAKEGSIINVTSVVGLTGNAGQANYAASKAGMIGLTKALARELASRNIRVNALAPGFVKTPMTEGLGEGVLEAIKNDVPLGRMGEPRELAQAALFLATATYVTGHTLVVDGGMAM